MGRKRTLDAAALGYTPTGPTWPEHFQQLLDEQEKRLVGLIEGAVQQFMTGLAAQDKAVQIAMIASEKAVVKAEMAAEKRFEATNEFRGQLSDQAATFMPRNEAEQRFAQLAAAVAELKEATTGSRMRSVGVNASWAMMLGAGGLLLTLIGVVVAVIVASN
jgi:hypothetical protein